MIRRLVLLASLVLASALSAIAEPPKEILWDPANGVLDLYEPSGYYADLTALLTDNGFAMTTSAAGVDNLDLSLYDILVVAITEPDVTITNVAPHPLFDGIDEVYLRRAGGLSVGSAGAELAWTDQGKPVVVASNDGHMVIVGDVNFCTNEHWEAADNAAFALNIFQFLAEAGPVPVAAETWTSVRELFR
jgi:hypothetical protein